MPNLSKRTITRIRKVIDAIVAEPKYYDQGELAQIEDCGATCCFSGWTVWLFERRMFNEMVAKNASYNAWKEEAERLLDLEDTGRDLFCCADCWPYRFTAMYNDAKTSLQRAKAMKARFEDYIAQDGGDPCGWEVPF